MNNRVGCEMHHTRGDAASDAPQSGLININHTVLHSISNILVNYTDKTPKQNVRGVESSEDAAERKRTRAVSVQLHHKTQVSELLAQT